MRSRIEKPIKVIIEAYLNDELKPGEPCHCFLGSWFGSAAWYQHIYTYRNFEHYNATYGEIIYKDNYKLKEISIIENTFEDSVNQIIYETFGISRREAIGTFQMTTPEIITTFKIDLFPAVLATFNKLVELEEDKENSQKILDNALNILHNGKREEPKTTLQTTQTAINRFHF